MVLQLFSYVTWSSFCRWQSDFGSHVRFQQPSAVTNLWFRVVDYFNSLHMVRTVLWSWVSNVIIRTTKEETADVHQRWRMLLCFKIHKNLQYTNQFWLLLQYITWNNRNISQHIWNCDPCIMMCMVQSDLWQNPTPSARDCPTGRKLSKDELIQAMSLWMEEQLFVPSLLKEDTNRSQYIHRYCDNNKFIITVSDVLVIWSSCKREGQTDQQYIQSTDNNKRMFFPPKKSNACIKHLLTFRDTVNKLHLTFI